MDKTIINVAVRATGDERTEWHDEAADIGMKYADYVRKLIDLARAVRANGQCIDQLHKHGGFEGLLFPPKKGKQS